MVRRHGRGGLRVAEPAGTWLYGRILRRRNNRPCDILHYQRESSVIVHVANC